MLEKAGSSNIFEDEAGKAKFSHPLHAMRGIAALLVFFAHIKNVVIPLESNGNVPFNGTVAVTFFYILSGLVVGASIAKHKITWTFYFDYGIRRFFRMMPLLFVTVTFGGIYLWWIDPHMPKKFLAEEYGDFSL